MKFFCLLLKSQSFAFIKIYYIKQIASKESFIEIDFNSVICYLNLFTILNRRYELLYNIKSNKQLAITKSD
jgi:hypothetical protein